MTAERTLVPEIKSALTAVCPSLRDGASADAVGDRTPAFVGFPASTDEAAALLRTAASAGLAVVPRGAGTGLGWGLPPSGCDLVVDLTAMDQVIEHAAGDLVVRVQAGVTIERLGLVLAEAGQQLALDAPAEATVGGVIASGTAGPRRLRYGSPRDLLIGVTAVRADGVIAHAGGKVVKNVAGYDLGKLLAGSQGTLALITEATFRLHPVPETVAYVTAEFGSSGRAAAVSAAQAAAGSPLLASAVELNWPPSAEAPLRVGVLLEGTSSGVAERARQLSELLGASAGEASAGEVGVAEVGVAEVAPARWGQLPSRGTVIRVTFWVSGLGDVLEAVTAAGASVGTRPGITGSAGAGVLYACLDPGLEPEVVRRFVAGLRDRVSGPRGSVVVLTGPEAGTYGPVPGAALMRAVKDQFDPEHRLFPGRLAGL